MFIGMQDGQIMQRGVVRVINTGCDQVIFHIDYSKVSNKRTVFNNSTGGVIHELFSYFIELCGAVSGRLS